MAIKRISANLLGGNAVTAAKIAGGAISATDIADNSITAAKLSTSTFAIDSLTVNTSDLVVDTANNRVGIGTNSPTSKLDVNGVVSLKGNDFLDSDTSSHYIKAPVHLYLYSNASDLNLTVHSSGNVGIGETVPLGKLHIKGNDVGATPSAQGNSLILEDTENGLSILSSTAAAGYINFGDSDDNNIGMIVYDHSTNSLRTFVNAAERTRIDSSGNVSIGHTSANSSRLHLKNSGGAGTPQLMITDSTSGRQSEIRHDTSGNLVFDHWTGSSRAERLRLDSSGTLNIATTGGTWSGFTGKIENYLSSWANWGNSGTLFAHNARYDGTNYVALGTGTAQRIWLNSVGQLAFETADSVSAGSALTFQNLMLLKKDSPTYQEVMEISSADRTLSTGQGPGIVFKGKINTDGSLAQLAQIVGFRDNTTNGYTSGGLSFYTRAVYTNPMVERIRIDEGGGIAINGINDLRADEAVVIGNSNSYGANQVAHLKVRDDIAKAGPDNGFSIFSVSKQLTANTSANIIRFQNREGAGVGHIYYGYSGSGIGRVKIDKVAFTYGESTLTNEIEKTRGSETLGLSISSSGDTHTISVLSNRSINVTLTLLINSCGISSTTHSTNIDKL